MAQTNQMNRMYLANIIEENDRGFHRETLWFGSTPENLALTVIDVMSGWYDDNKDDLAPAAVQYHKKLEDGKHVTFKDIGTGCSAGVMSVTVEMTNDLNDMFGFVVAEICDIFAQDGETPQSFGSLAEFREHFTRRYEMDEDFNKVLKEVNEITVSKALYLIDMKYDYTDRHTLAAGDKA